MPLSQVEYKKLLEQVPTIFEGVKAQRVRALIQLMRHSALAIRDAVTLERSELVHDAFSNRSVSLLTSPRFDIYYRSSTMSALLRLS
jgi:hypothetical protein